MNTSAFEKLVPGRLYLVAGTEIVTECHDQVGLFNDLKILGEMIAEFPWHLSPVYIVRLGRSGLLSGEDTKVLWSESEDSAIDGI